VRRLKPLQAWRPMTRAAIGFIGAMIFAFGVLTLLGGRQYYSNYWGGAVFAPFALVIGGLVFLVALRKRKTSSQRIEARHQRPALIRMHREKVSRNAPCSCGSGLKYKHCCLAKDEEHDRQQQELDQRRSVDVMEGPAETFHRAFDRPWKRPKA
jgi:hypothetical protein